MIKALFLEDFYFSYLSITMKNKIHDWKQLVEDSLLWISVHVE